MTLVLAWIRAHRNIATVVAAVLSVLAIGLCRGRNAALPTREQKTLDSLEVTKPPFDSAQERRAKAETVYVRQRVQAVAGANVAAASAEASGRRADSLQRLAEQERDTSTLWRATALERGRQADSLKSSNVQLRVALVSDTAALAIADSIAREERRRRLAAEDLIPRLVADVKGAKGGIFQRLKDRTGVSVGYGAQIDAAGGLHTGFQVNAGVKVWP